MKKYSDYTYTEMPENYGDGYSAAEREGIAGRVCSALERQFPGLRTNVSSSMGARTPTRGPDDSVIDDINDAAGRAFATAINQ